MFNSAGFEHSVASSEPASVEIREASQDDDDDDAATLARETSATNSNTFRSIAEQHMQAAAEDLTDTDPLLPPSTTTASGSTLQPISTLFKFDDAWWRTVFSRTVIPSYNQELELLELLDLDAEGEVVDVDETTAQVLLG